ncbi:MAG: hypothetical protein HYY32_05335 [Chloroflexi bacterium]|nr:hypothetical protein [Chloroflexota bacterium]
MPIRVVKPVPERKNIMRLAPRPSSLKDKTIGTLWNSKPHADEFLSLVAERIAQRHGASRIVHLQKAHINSVAPASVLRELVSTCDVVICAVGD